MYRVGEFAEKAGVTVRTLHHYDRVGLLRPTGRSSAGHRLFIEQRVLPRSPLPGLEDCHCAFKRAGLPAGAPAFYHTAERARDNIKDLAEYDNS